MSNEYKKDKKFSEGYRGSSSEQASRKKKEGHCAQSHVDVDEHHLLRTLGSIQPTSDNLLCMRRRTSN